jgi:hypothetical protein
MCYKRIIWTKKQICKKVYHLELEHVGAKHKYIPTVWMEGKKMIKRGKAVLQQSNDEIVQTLKNKDRAKRNKESRIRTDNEVRSGAQTTLANFVTVKVDKQQNKTPSKTIHNAKDNEHTVKGNVQDQSSGRM